MDYLRKRYQNRFKDLSAEHKCYVLGALLVIFSAILFLFNGAAVKTGAQIGAFVFALGLIPLIEQLYQWAWRKLLGKLFIVALIALTTNLAYGFGRQIVAAMVGTSPESFGATVQLATILVSPILFLLALAIGGIFIIPFATGASVMALLFPSITKCKATLIFRFIALTIAFLGSLDLLNRSAGYSGWAERRTAGYLYTFDMYADSHYASGENEKIAVLRDGRLLVGTPSEGGEGYTFQIKHIQKNIQTAPLHPAESSTIHTN